MRLILIDFGSRRTTARNNGPVARRRSTPNSIRDEPWNQLISSDRSLLGRNSDDISAGRIIDVADVQDPVRLRDCFRPMSYHDLSNTKLPQAVCNTAFIVEIEMASRFVE